MFIKDLSKKLKITSRAIRHYEEIGIITSKRMENNYRYFDESNLDKLKSTSKSSLSNASKFLNTVAEQIESKDQLVIGTRLKIFFNKYVREGKKLPSDKVFVKEFQEYFETEVRKAADKLKTPKGKAQKLNKLYDESKE